MAMTRAPTNGANPSDYRPLPVESTLADAPPSDDATRDCGIGSSPPASALVFKATAARATLITVLAASALQCWWHAQAAWPEQDP